jgi:hypothetical protein
MFGLASDGTTLYGVAGTTIYKIDPTTGAATALLDYSGHGLAAANGAAFINESSGPVVPVPSSAYAGLALLAGLGLVSFGKRLFVARS